MTDSSQKVEQRDRIRSITLRFCIFFGLTTFVLFIAIFYVEALLKTSRKVLKEKEMVIVEQEKTISEHENEIKQKDLLIQNLQSELNRTTSSQE